jgi:hypothetical protein
MPATDAHAMPSIAAHWIKNNVVAAIIFRAASLVIYGISQAAGAEDARSDAAVVLLYLADIASWVLAGIAYGVLTGAVLQRIVPHLPVRAWIAMQGVLAGIMAVDGASGFTAALASVPASADDDGLFEAVLLFFAAFIGAIVGALGGGAEALVLRRAASGTLAWIGWSAVAYAIILVLLTGSARLGDTGTGFTGELTRQALAFLGALIGAVVMLPALRRLKDPLLSKAGAHFD